RWGWTSPPTCIPCPTPSRRCSKPGTPAIRTGPCRWKGGTDMLRDITIGQHFPGHSVLHRCDPRLKLVGVIAYIIVLFLASNPLGITLSLGMLVLLYGVARIPLRLILKSLKPI